MRIKVLVESNTKLKNEMSKWKTILQRELGEENISLEKLESQINTEGWKGRAQRIVLLQNKLKDLKSKYQSLQASKSIQ